MMIGVFSIISVGFLFFFQNYTKKKNTRVVVIMRIVDLRSDTVTMPTQQMREAMYKAEVGDDVYGEDPTVKELEELGARLTGKEAGLFVTSGTMGNQIAAMTHTKKSDEIICETESHIYYFEVGGLACLSGAQVRPVTAPRGILTAELIKQHIRGNNVHVPDTGLICLENTHNRAGGTCHTLQGLADIQALAATYQIPVHMDGARVFNAAVATKVPVAQITQYADTVQLCLSKGLCAPVGSLLVGKKEWIDRARRFRKMVGGGLRQAGVIASAGIVALTQMVDRLQEDHDNARILGEALADIGFSVDLETVQTNIVIVSVEPFGLKAEKFVDHMHSAGIKASDFGEYKVRFVTHHGITRTDIDHAISVISKIIRG
jgi:threonine aldolase